MSRSSKLFESIPIDIKKRSGFDLSHENLLTQTCGTITPIMIDELLPNDTVSLGIMSQVQLPPLATNFYGRVDVAVEVFFVPFRLLWGGWKEFYVGADYNPFSPDYVVPKGIPYLTISSNSTSLFSPGTLADYLDYDITLSSLSASVYSILPFIAYHRVFDDWYRNKNLHKPVFVNPWSSSDWIGSDTSDIQSSPELLPYITSVNSNGDPMSVDLNALLFDGVKVGELRQRQWEKDLFTTCSLYPQASVTPSKVTFDASKATGEFTIAQLRNANVIQRFLERNNLAGYDYYNEIYAHFGIKPSDQHLDKPYFINSHRFSIYSQGVTNVSTGNATVNTKNPFVNLTGGKSGQAQGLSKGSLIDSFTAKEHGYLMVFSTIVPHAYYSSGTSRINNHVKLYDFANPLLEGLGEVPVLNSEAYAQAGPQLNSIFGYQQQYYEYKYKLDRVHGLLKQGASLSAFALQRTFQQTPILGVNFVEIPKNFLDQVFAVGVSASSFSAWSDYFFNYKKISSLSEYVIPTLGDMKHTYTTRIPYRGLDIRG